MYAFKILFVHFHFHNLHKLYKVDANTASAFLPSLTSLIPIIFIS